MVERYRNIPEELKDLPQWVVHRNKFPINPHDGTAASSTDSNTWGTFHEALKAYETGKYDGLSFAFNDQGIVGIDLDHCVDKQSGGTHLEALNVIRKIKSYTEFSPSGTGFHIYAYGQIPEGRKDSKKQKGFEIEMYKAGRFFTVTGETYGEICELNDSSEEIRELFDDLFRRDPAPIAQRQVAQTDDDFLSIGLSKDAALIALWNGDRPSSDESSNDLAFMNKLVYWTNCDKDQAIAAFLRSPYATNKDKEHTKKMNRLDYLDRTAETAIRNCKSTAAGDNLTFQESRATLNKIENNVLPKEHSNKKQKEPPKLIKLFDVEDTEVSWLWEPYIQANNLSILRGDGGVGKTYLSAAVASAISNEFSPAAMPGTVHQTGTVIYFGSEDDPGTLKRRVKACGGDLRRISLVTDSFSMDDTETLARFIREENAKLVIFDPLQAFLGAGIDMNRANEVRPILDGLRKVARDEECAVLIIEHQNKMTSQKSLYRGIGSMDIVAAARSVLLAGYHPDDENKRVLVQIKTNSKKGAPVAFSILEDGSFEWNGIATVTEEEVMNASSGNSFANKNKTNPTIEGAVAILKEHQGGWKGTSSEFMLEASRLMPESETLFEPIAIGKFFRSGPGLVQLKRKDIALNYYKRGGKTIYELSTLQKTKES